MYFTVKSHKSSRLCTRYWPSYIIGQLGEIWKLCTYTTAMRVRIETDLGYLQGNIGHKDLGDLLWTLPSCHHVFFSEHKFGAKMIISCHMLVTGYAQDMLYYIISAVDDFCEVCSDSKNGWFLTIYNGPYLADFFMVCNHHPILDNVICLCIEQKQFWMIVVIQGTSNCGWFYSSTFGWHKVSSTFGWFKYNDISAFIH